CARSPRQGDAHKKGGPRGPAEVVHHREKGCGDGRLAWSPVSSRGGGVAASALDKHTARGRVPAPTNFFERTGRDCRPPGLTTPCASAPATELVATAEVEWSSGERLREGRRFVCNGRTAPGRETTNAQEQPCRNPRERDSLPGARP